MFARNGDPGHGFELIAVFGLVARPGDLQPDAGKPVGSPRPFFLVAAFAALKEPGAGNVLAEESGNEIHPGARASRPHIAPHRLDCLRYWDRPATAQGIDIFLNMDAQVAQD